MKTRSLLLVAFTVALALSGRLVHAATGSSNTTWANPTTYTDGSPLAASEITGYSFMCTFTPAGGTAAPCGGFSPTSVNAGAQTTVTSTFTYPAIGGVACFQVAAKVGAMVGDYSDITPASCKPFAALKPGKPTAVTVVVTVATNAAGQTTLKVAAH
jgi:hypothetical protein